MAEEELVRLQNEAERLDALKQKKYAYFDSVILGLQCQEYGLEDLLMCVSDPIHKQGIVRWELFHDRTVVSKLLDLWAFKSSPTSREQIKEWAVNHTSNLVKTEA